MSFGGSADSFLGDGEGKLFVSVSKLFAKMFGEKFIVSVSKCFLIF